MDSYKDHSSTLTAPVRDAEAAVDGIDTTLGRTSRALYVGVGGDLAVELAEGTTVTFRGVPAGSLLPFRATRILGTLGTATGVVALW